MVLALWCPLPWAVEGQLGPFLDEGLWDGAGENLCKQDGSGDSQEQEIDEIRNNRKTGHLRSMSVQVSAANS